VSADFQEVGKSVGQHFKSCRGEGRVLARMEGPNSPVTLARAYEKMTYSHCSAASLLPCNPVQRQGGVIPVFFSWHHTAHHIPQTPKKSPEPDRWVQDLTSQWLGSGLGPFASPKPTKTFLSTVLCLSVTMASNYLP